MSITSQILAHNGPHPDRLSMHTETVERMIDEQEYAQFNHYRIDWQKPTFGPTPIYHDSLIDKDVVIFERRGGNIKPFVVGNAASTPFKPSEPYTETHRITLT